SGLSEGILWDVKNNSPAALIMDYFGFPLDILPEIVPSFSIQGELTREAAGELGLKPGTPLSYRAGDQPNNAFSLNVLNPGELAATAGTSGVVYGIVGKPAFDRLSRVNTFVHVNHTENDNRYGILLCLNGTGILNRWLKQNISFRGGEEMSYQEMNRVAESVPVGSGGLVFLPYGNGAERTLENADPGASLHGLNFNIHSQSHLLRAGQEGIVFALNYGFEIMKEMGMELRTVKAGYANMFLSPLFRNAFSTITGAEVELYTADGALGAARGAGIGAGIYTGFKEAFIGLEKKETVSPDYRLKNQYKEAYGRWHATLKKVVSQTS
ncbi:MAG: FGGY-family carbohydrate kinase, partial [Spirochaetota bacterium]